MVDIAISVNCFIWFPLRCFDQPSHHTRVCELTASTRHGSVAEAAGAADFLDVLESRDPRARALSSASLNKHDKTSAVRTAAANYFLRACLGSRK
jgi:hypothetical protein